MPNGRDEDARPPEESGFVMNLDSTARFRHDAPPSSAIVESSINHPTGFRPVFESSHVKLEKRAVDFAQEAPKSAL